MQAEILHFILLFYLHLVILRIATKAIRTEKYGLYIYILPNQFTGYCFLRSDLIPRLQGLSPSILAISLAP